MPGDSVPPSALRTPHSLVPLFPAFLRRRRRGFPRLEALIAETGLSRPAFFLLHRALELGPEGATAEELRPGAPYATRDPHLPWLAEATEAGYLARDDAGRYRLTERGLAQEVRSEREATAWFATLAPLPEPELAQLAERFAAIAAGLDTVAGGPGAHLHRSRRVAALAPEASAAALVRLERVVFDLWMARDDAHIGAWRTARFDGPALDVLTRLWRGEAETLPALSEVLAATQDPADVDAAVEELVEQGYVERRGETLSPTHAGDNVRESIEADTDHLYFRQWPPLDPHEVAWLHDALRRVIDNLPEAP